MSPLARNLQAANGGCAVHIESISRMLGRGGALGQGQLLAYVYTGESSAGRSQADALTVCSRGGGGGGGGGGDRFEQTGPELALPNVSMM